MPRKKKPKMCKNCCFVQTKFVGANTAYAEKIYGEKNPDLRVCNRRSSTENIIIVSADHTCRNYCRGTEEWRKELMRGGSDAEITKLPPDR